MQSYLRSKIHFMFMAASSVTRYLRTNGSATRVIVWADMHVRHVTWPRFPACIALKMSGCPLQASPASHRTPGPLCWFRYVSRTVFDSHCRRTNPGCKCGVGRACTLRHSILHVLKATWVTIS